VEYRSVRVDEEISKKGLESVSVGNPFEVNNDQRDKERVRKKDHRIIDPRISL